MNDKEINNVIIKSNNLSENLNSENVNSLSDGDVYNLIGDWSENSSRNLEIILKHKELTICNVFDILSKNRTLSKNIKIRDEIQAILKS